MHVVITMMVMFVTIFVARMVCIMIVLVIIALAAQWFRQDRVDSSRFDLAQDSGEEDALGAYNDMLRQLAERDAEDARRRANEIGLRP